MTIESIKKSLFIGIPILIIIVISCTLGIISYNQTNHLSKFFDENRKQFTDIISLVENQKKVNYKLLKEVNNKNNTLDEAYVELNPYEISPLSAVIIFNTTEKEEVRVYINDKLSTTLEPSYSHVVPVYGLYEDYENIVKLETDTRSKEYTIKTEPSNIEYTLDVVEKSENINEDEIYFTVSSLKTHLTGWDTEGKLRFYLTTDNRMDVEWLENGHFIIGTTQDERREQFLGFVEMDYLGKIYNYYTEENGFSFESQILSNGNIMTAGGDKAIYFTHQYVYEIDPSNGKKVSELDLAEVIKKVDPDFNNKYLGPDAIRNGFYYDEETKELLVSFREIATIFSFNYETKELNWVLTDPENPEFQNEVWKDYFVKLESGRYPLGQHTPQITSEGYIAFFNNGYDRYKVYVQGESDAVENYKDAYSSCEIYDIKNKVGKLVWSYDQNKELFSIKYGLFRVGEDNSKLMNFGYILTDEYRSQAGNSIKQSESKPESMYVMILELDANDNVIFKATSKEGKYRVFKHTLYNETTKNMNVSEYNIYNTIPEDELRQENYKNIDLDNTYEWINTLNITRNTFTSDYEIQADDSIKIYYVNEVGKIFVLNYKEKDSVLTKRIFNANLGKGKYSVFININDVIYDTNSIIEYK